MRYLHAVCAVLPQFLDRLGDGDDDDGDDGSVCAPRDGACQLNNDVITVVTAIHVLNALTQRSERLAA